MMSRKYILLLSLINIIFYVAAMPKFSTFNSSKDKPLSNEGIIAFSNVFETSYRNFNIRNLEMEIEEAGDYFVTFWILPAQHVNGTFTKYYIYLNANFIGTITPSIPGWQSLCLDDSQNLKLDKGRNILSIAVKAPEIPMIESVNISPYKEFINFSEDNYTEFLRLAHEGFEYNLDNIYRILDIESNLKMEDSDRNSLLPLLYTFHNYYTFHKDETIKISASSDSDFKIDMVYFGSTDSISIKQNDQHSYNLVFPGIDPRAFKTKYLIKPATSEQMQGLNWMRPSESFFGTSNQVATMYVRIPITGVYLVRVRHALNGMTGTINININNEYSYQDMPISFNCIDKEMKAGPTTYATLTVSDNVDRDDPMLFIHGALADRVIGFNDDGPYNILKNYGASSYDAYIMQRYIFKSSRISVSNCSSLTPVSLCKIVNGHADNINYNEVEFMENPRGIKRNIRSQNTSFQDNENLHLFPDKSRLLIQSNTVIKKIFAYNLLGNLIGFTTIEDKSAYLPLKDIGIKDSNIYLIGVETTDNFIVKKLYFNIK